jgi:hypothetical protein
MAAFVAVSSATSTAIRACDRILEILMRAFPDRVDALLNMREEIAGGNGFPIAEAGASEKDLPGFLESR